MNRLPIGGVKVEAKSVNFRRFMTVFCSQRDVNLLSVNRLLQKVCAFLCTQMLYEILRSEH